MNKDKINEKIKKLGLTLGCWDNDVNNLNYSNLRKVLKAMDGKESTDVDVNINREKYVVEIHVVDNEIDFNVISQYEYIEVYGNER